MLRNILYIAAVLAFTACARKVSPSGSGASELLSNYSEDISHLLPKYEEVSKEATESKEESAPEQIVFTDDNEKVNATFNRIIEHNKNFNNGQGFRIQVFAGNSRGDFENAKSFMLRNFPQLEIYESYSQPTYRIRVGDFLYYQDAEKYSGMLKQRFGTTRIVSEKINIKKALDTK